MYGKGSGNYKSYCRDKILKLGSAAENSAHVCDLRFSHVWGQRSSPPLRPPPKPVAEPTTIVFGLQRLLQEQARRHFSVVGDKEGSGVSSLAADGVRTTAEGHGGCSA